MQYSVYQILQLFLLYAFLGWCMEVCYAAVTTGKIVNRGFLNGPVCPIYGVGMVGAMLLLEPIAENLVLLFFGGMALCTAIELIGGWVLKQVFDTRWWDYSDQPFNLGGYICLSFSIIWGFAVVFIMRLVHPAIVAFAGAIPTVLGWVLIAVCYTLFAADFAATLVTIIGLKKQIRELDRIAQAIHTASDSLSEKVGGSALAADEKLDQMKQASQEKMAESREKLDQMKQASQEKMAESREKLAEARESGQKRLEDARDHRMEKRAESRERFEKQLDETRKELQQHIAAMEQRYREQQESFANRFGARRLGNAYPRLRQAIRDHMNRK